MTKTNLHSIFPTNPALQKIIGGKIQHKERNYTLEKARQHILSTNPKEESYTNIILATKISGSKKNQYALISLNINGLNSSI